MNILFLINTILVSILSLGAVFFTLMPWIMGFTEPERILSMVTQNYAMIGLWIIYFISIIFLPITLKKRDRKLIIVYGVFIISIVIFVLFIIGILSCWEATLLKFFGFDYNHGIRCVNE